MLVSLDRKHSSVVEFYGNEASYISYTLETFNISDGISCHVLYMYMRMTCVGAQNVAQFQSTSEQSVTELHKEYKEHKWYSIYIVSLIAVYNKHYYMQELVLLYKASRTRVARIGGENVCECWIFTSGSNCRENSRVNAYTQKYDWLIYLMPSLEICMMVRGGRT